MQRSKTVDDYIASAELWQKELRQLRDILRSTELEETIKWGMPVYTLHGKNVVGIAGFKNHFGLWFYQGALLEDPRGVLMNAQEGKTKAMRQWRFDSAAEIKPRYIKAYVKESIQQFRDGHEIKADRSKKLVIPPELRTALAKSKKTQAAFDALTKGKQREYADYVAQAKRDATKASRIKKILPMIASGKGLNDRYR